MRHVVVASLVLAAACAGGQKTETGEVNVKLRRVVVGEANYDKMTVKVVAVVENGTSNDVKVSNGTATVTVEGQGTSGSAAAADAEDRGEEEAAADDAPAEGGASDVFPGSFTGKGGGGTAIAFKDSEVVVPVTLDLPDDPDALGQVIDWKSAKLRVSGTLDVNGSTKTFGGAREVPPPRLPAVILKEAQVASQDQGRNGAAFFKVGLDNKNTFDVAIDRVAWSISVGGKELRPAGEGERESVPASSVVELEDQVELDEKAFGKDLKALLSQPTVPYVIDGFLEVKGMKRPFHFEGEMQFAR